MHLIIIITKMQQQYYFHGQYLNKGQTKNVKPVKIANQQMLCMSNDSSLDIYEYALQGISFKQRYNFHCYISKIQVLPNKHQNTDYFFIMDAGGRYAFWHPDGGFQFVQNSKHQNKEYQNLYRTNVCENQPSFFCGQIHHFNVLDTKGSIFFNINHQIVLIDYSIKALGLKIEKTRKITIEMNKFRYLGWIQNGAHQKWLGIIQEMQQKTILKIFNIERTSTLSAQTQLFKHQQMSLIQFMSIQNNSLLLLSQNQLIVLSMKNFQKQFSFKIQDTFGKLLNINNEVYGYLGEELILMKGTQLKSYGSLDYQGENILQGKGVYETRFLRNLPNGGKLISITTLNYEVILIIIYQNAWRLWYKMDCITPIFSLHPTSNPNSLLAVTSSKFNKYQVSLIQRQLCISMMKEQAYPDPVQKIISLDKGKTIIVSSKINASILRFNNLNQLFQKTSLQLPEQQVITANEKYYITDKAIYSLDLQQETLTLLKTDVVIMADIKNQYFVYLNELNQVITLELQTGEFKHVRQIAPTEYLWSLNADLQLFMARSDDLEHLFKFRGSELIEEINLHQSSIISAINYLTSGNETFVVIGMIKGSLLILNHNNQIIFRFEGYSTGAVSFFSFAENSIGVISGDKQYIVYKQEAFKVKELQLSYKNKNIESIAYLSQQKMIIFSEGDRQYGSTSLKMISTQSIGSKSIQKQVMDDYSLRTKKICCYDDQIPIVLLQGKNLYVAIKNKIVIFDVRSGKITKQLGNFIKDVIGIEQLECGVCVYGVDELGRNILNIISTATLETIKTINLILKDNKYIKTLLAIGPSKPNHFICRGQKYTTLYELTDTFQVNELQEIKIQYQGYSLDLDQQHSLFAITDSFKFAAFYTFQNAILPVSRYVLSAQINDLALLHKCSLLGDRTGNLTLLEFNVENQQQVLRMLMTQVGSIRVGAEVSVISKINQNSAFYGTVSGKVGRVTIIDEQIFIKLKQIQRKMVEQLSKRCIFDYSKWKNRVVSQDKMIDSTLIKEYLKQLTRRQRVDEKQEPDYIQILGLYKKLLDE